MADATGQCRYCTATWGDIGLGCADRHGERQFAVARQIAAKIHGKDATDAQIGGFMEDAETICDAVDDPAPIVRWESRTMRLYAGGAAFRVAEEDGGLELVRTPKKAAS